VERRQSEERRARHRPESRQQPVREQEHLGPDQAPVHAGLGRWRRDLLLEQPAFLRQRLRQADRRLPHGQQALHAVRVRQRQGATRTGPRISRLRRAKTAAKARSTACSTACSARAPASSTGRTSTR
jgi:hypothetical protein